MPAEPNLLSSLPSIRSGLGSRAMPRFHAGVPEIVTLCLYAGLLAWAIPYHKPWADEAQAWQIARTLPLRQIFPLLSYEGHPGPLVSLLVGAVSVARKLHRHALFCGGDSVSGSRGSGNHFALSPFTQAAVAFHLFPRLPIRGGRAQLCVGATAALSLRLFLAAKTRATFAHRRMPGTACQRRTSRRDDLRWLGHCVSHRPLVEATSI